MTNSETALKKASKKVVEYLFSDDWCFLNLLVALLPFNCVQKMKAEAKLEESKERLMDMVGTRGIQHLVEQRRHNGTLMPFRVSLRKHSRLALVSMWDEDVYLTEEV
jgi:hypothetical protein